MITFTITYTVLNPNGTVYLQREVKCRKMDDKMFKHYCENPSGMDKIVRAHFNIPDDNVFTNRISLCDFDCVIAFNHNNGVYEFMGMSFILTNKKIYYNGRELMNSLEKYRKVLLFQSNDGTGSRIEKQ